ncbi:MAG: nitronate monooxygenase [Thermoanaerobaculales bacterium]|nr:nitronate monooxygenase [Thermoanaerobaculales bacterium]
MKTRLTERFEIEHPVLLSGMSWISTPEMVAAVCNAGGLGILATGVLSGDDTRDYIRRARELTDRPFAANTTLYFPGAERNAQILLDEKVPVVNYSLGKGDWICEAVHAYGGKVIATVTTHKHAKAAMRDGADALIVTGYEAGGHGGAVTSLVLVPAIADAVEIPVIAAGGFADGRGLAAALALGADGIAMGTRFMNTTESPVHDSAKQMSIAKTVQDTIYTNRVDGLPARVAKNTGAARLMRSRFGLLAAIKNSREIARMLGFPWAKLAAGILLSGPKKSMQMARMANGFTAFRVGTTEGDQRRGVLPLGQVTGLVNDTPSAAEVVTRVVAEAEEICGKLVNK